MGWLQEGNNWYFLSWFDRNNNGYPEGYKIKDKTMTIDGVSYTFDSNGVCQSTPRLGWVFENESDFDSTGEPLQAQRWEYYEPTGKILSGWHELPAKNGSETNHWFYFENGVAYLGWLEQEGNWYYLKLADDNNNGLVEGYMLQNITYNIDGIDYVFDSSGVCQNPPSSQNNTNSLSSGRSIPPQEEVIEENNDDSSSTSSTEEENKEHENTTDDNTNNNNEEEENEDTSSEEDNSSNVSASIAGLLGEEKTSKGKFVLPKEAYNLRRYFMGIY